MVDMGMGGEKDVKIKVFRLYKDGQLAVDPKGCLGGGGATVGEVEIDPDKRSGGGFQDKTVLPKEPDGEGIRRDREPPNTPHKRFTVNNLLKHKLNWDCAIKWIVSRVIVVGSSSGLPSLDRSKRMSHPSDDYR